MLANGTAKEIFLLEITENHDFHINFFLYQKLRKTYILTKNSHFKSSLRFY